MKHNPMTRALADANNRRRILPDKRREERAREARQKHINEEDV